MRVSDQGGPCHAIIMPSLSIGGEEIMATISVRQLNDHTLEVLKVRAAGNHRSLEGEVRDILESVAAADTAAKRKSFLAFVDRLGLKARRGGPTGAELIRKGREWHLQKIRKL